MEGYITLFKNEPEGNKPHYKGFLKIDGVDHEFALWPAKEGKKGFSGKYKPKEERGKPQPKTLQDAPEIKPSANWDEVPF